MRSAQSHADAVADQTGENLVVEDELYERKLFRVHDDLDEVFHHVRPEDQYF